MMLAAACGADSELIELPEAQRQAVAELAQAVHRCRRWCRRWASARRPPGTSAGLPGARLVEAALVRLAEADKFVDPASLIERWSVWPRAVRRGRGRARPVRRPRRATARSVRRRTKKKGGRSAR